MQAKWSAALHVNSPSGGHCTEERPHLWKVYSVLGTVLNPLAWAHNPQYAPAAKFVIQFPVCRSASWNPKIWSQILRAAHQIVFCLRYSASRAETKWVTDVWIEHFSLFQLFCPTSESPWYPMVSWRHTNGPSHPHSLALNRPHNKQKRSTEVLQHNQDYPQATWPMVWSSTNWTKNFIFRSK